MTKYFRETSIKPLGKLIFNGPLGALKRYFSVLYGGCWY